MIKYIIYFIALILIPKVIIGNDTLDYSGNSVHSFGNSLEKTSKENSLYSTYSLTLKNNSKQDSIYLKIENFTLDYIKIIAENQTKTGGILNEKKNKHQIFSFNHHKGIVKKYIITIKSNKSLNLGLKIAPLNVLTNQIKTKSTFINIFIGLFFSLSLYNFLLFITIKEKQYLFFSLFVFFSGLVQIVFLGHLNSSLLNDWLITRSLHLSSCLNAISTLIFFNSIFLFKKSSKFLYKIFIFELFAYIFVFFLSFSKQHLFLSYQIINFLSFPVILLIVFTFKGEFSRLKIAKLILFSLIIFISAQLIHVLREFSIIPYTQETSFILPIGVIFTYFVLVIAISNNYQLLKLQKDKTTSEKLDLIKQNQLLVKNQKHELELQVQERTKELNETNEELEVAYQHLQNNQKAQIEAEKMSSLGQLTAGIAHELNNPINFIHNNVEPLREDLKEILVLIHKYEDAKKLIPDTAIIADIDNYKKEIDFEYLQEEIRVLLNGIEDGSRRTSEIVQSLKIYSHLDSGEMRSSNILQGLKSTIVIMRSNFKTECEITTAIDQNIDEIVCFPGKLNQVFMNLINNAIHASIEKNSSYKDRKVNISCHQDEQNLIVSVKDNGNGIPDDVLVKIFDPFFSTKKIGTGTGLGLSISKTIIENHNGTIKINTEKGKGTEFIVTLPRNYRLTNIAI